MNPITNNLRRDGERMTPIRTELLKILSKSKQPQTSQELLQALKKKGLSANKTTIYRQVEVLQQYNVVQAVHFTDRSKRYELVHESGHHHHLVCLTCGNIQDIVFATDLEQQEQQIRRENKFRVDHHLLEFFGTCASCQRRKK